jgi:hypothetical protein
VKGGGDGDDGLAYPGDGRRVRGLERAHDAGVAGETGRCRGADGAGECLDALGDGFGYCRWV